MRLQRQNNMCLLNNGQNFEFFVVIVRLISHEREQNVPIES